MAGHTARGATAAGRIALAELRALPCNADLPADTIPPVESLADALARAVPCWIDVLAVDLRAGRTQLVVAHGNAGNRGPQHPDRLSRYDFDADLRPLHRGGRYLDPVAAAHASAAVAWEGTAADVNGLVSRAAGRP